jgi:hypothetical protein
VLCEVAAAALGHDLGELMHQCGKSSDFGAGGEEFAEVGAALVSA